jgi:hypothetical protein
MKKVFYVFPLLAMMFLVSCGGPKWEPLFNGKDFSGWEFYLGVPDPSVDVPGMERNEEGVYTQPVGLGKDPLNVFSVVQEDGAPALRFSGEIFGSFSTVAEYENYHLRLEVKWGEKIWFPSRWNGRRNSGLLYHGIGEFGAGLGVWKISHELQVMENDFGDSFRMGDTYCDITASRNERGRGYTYDPAAPAVRFGPLGTDFPAICSKNPVNEKPAGQWNTIELLCYEGTSIHVINGTVNMINTNSHILVNGKEVPLTKGVIQLQSEGAEIFYRNIEIRPISKIPAEYLR